VESVITGGRSSRFYLVSRTVKILTQLPGTDLAKLMHQSVFLCEGTDETANYELFACHLVTVEFSKLESEPGASVA
jgi:hypothetical protein